MVRCAVLSIIFVIVLLGATPAVEASANFKLSGQDVLSQQLVTFPKSESRTTVIVFLSAKCPCSAGHEVTLKALHEKYAAHGFDFVAVHSNQDEKAELTLSHFKASALPFQVVQDDGAKIADQFKALKTPHAYVLKNDKIVYQGGVDDSADPTESKKHFLEDALNSIKNGKPILVTQARALGCAIKR